MQSEKLKLTVNCDTPRQYLMSAQISDIRPRSKSRDRQNSAFLESNDDISGMGGPIDLRV